MCKGSFHRQGAKAAYARYPTRAGPGCSPSSFRRRDNIKELGDDLDFALGRVSEEDRLAILIQWLKTDEAVLPANLGGPIRSALGRER